MAALPNGAFLIVGTLAGAILTGRIDLAKRYSAARALNVSVFPLLLRHDLVPTCRRTEPRHPLANKERLSLKLFAAMLTTPAQGLSPLLSGGAGADWRAHGHRDGLANSPTDFFFSSANIALP
jgi:hypothetical protein